VATNTPLHTIDILRSEIAKGGDHTGIAGNSFLSVDTRVLTWLLDDAARLNRLEVAAMERNFESVEDMLHEYHGPEV
jgi:hypothetical protein